MGEERGVRTKGWKRLKRPENSPAPPAGPFIHATLLREEFDRREGESKRERGGRGEKGME
jgi:hypothetical protein